MAAVVRFDPLATLAALDSEFDALMRRTLSTSAQAWVPAADITREGPDTLVTLEIPGVPAGAVGVEVVNRTLVISGSRPEPVRGEGTQEMRREIRRGEFSRQFRLPEHVTAADVTATCVDGLLTVRVANTTPPAPVPTRIEVNGTAATVATAA